jgi:cytochrome c oxidase subunit 4
MENQANKHILSYKTLFSVWLILVVLTAITIGVTKLELGVFTVATALLIASVKACFVLYYFMHLKFESRLLNVFVAIVFLVFTSFIVLTFIDYIYR